MSFAKSSKNKPDGSINFIIYKRRPSIWSSRARNVFQSKFKNGTCHMVKGRQTVHINHDRAYSESERSQKRRRAAFPVGNDKYGALWWWTLYRNRLALPRSVIPPCVISIQKYQLQLCHKHSIKIIDHSVLCLFLTLFFSWINYSCEIPHMLFFVLISKFWNSSAIIYICIDNLYSFGLFVPLIYTIVTFI